MKDIKIQKKIIKKQERTKKTHKKGTHYGDANSISIIGAKEGISATHEQRHMSMEDNKGDIDHKCSNKTNAIVLPIK